MKVDKVFITNIPSFYKIKLYNEISKRIDIFVVFLSKNAKDRNSDFYDNKKKATLLINPRPTKEEYVKYSFPSKNMEYMASGTPVLTTVLPGMPEEYYSYVYLLKHENENGISEILQILLQKDKKELEDMGRMAQQFVIEKKRGSMQCIKIYNLINRMFYNNENTV